MLLILSTFLSTQFADWKELVVDSSHNFVQEIYTELAPALESKMPVSNKIIRTPPNLYFDRKVKRVLLMFGSSIEKGLESSKIPELLDYYGMNELPAAPKPSALKMIFQQVSDFMVMVFLMFNVLVVLYRF